MLDTSDECPVRGVSQSVAPIVALKVEGAVHFNVSVINLMRRANGEAVGINVLQRQTASMLL